MRTKKKVISAADLPESSDSSEPALAKNIDELSVAARDLLMNNNLEVSKVRPFFWSMVETYVDRFQIYPFDIVKAMLSYLETRDFPEEQTRELVNMLEQGYLQQHGKSLNPDAPQPAATSSGDTTEDALSSTSQYQQQSDDIESLDDELRELRACLKYAAMVGEMESQK